MKNIIFVFTYLLISQFLFCISQDLSEDINKQQKSGHTFELNVGISGIIYPGVGFTWVLPYTNAPLGSHVPVLGYCFRLQLSIPITLSWFVRNNFSVGIDINSGIIFNIPFHYDFSCISTIFHKIGNDYSYYKTIIQYGNITMVRLLYSNSNQYIGVWLGPHTGIGFEKNIKEYLSFMFIGTLNYSLLLDKRYLTYQNSIEWDLKIGLEFRFFFTNWWII